MWFKTVKVSFHGGLHSFLYGCLSNLASDVIGVFFHDVMHSTGTSKSGFIHHTISCFFFVVGGAGPQDLYL